MDLSRRASPLYSRCVRERERVGVCVCLCVHVRVCVCVCVCVLVGRPHHVLDHGHHNLGQSLALQCVCVFACVCLCACKVADMWGQRVSQDATEKTKREEADGWRKQRSTTTTTDGTTQSHTLTHTTRPTAHAGARTHARTHTHTQTCWRSKSEMVSSARSRSWPVLAGKIMSVAACGGEIFLVTWGGCHERKREDSQW